MGGYRASGLIARLNERAWNFQLDQECHYACIETAFKYLVDLPFLVFGIAASVMMVRIPRFFSRIKQAETDWERRWVCVFNFWLSCIDLPLFVLMCVTTVIGSFYGRSVLLCRDLSKHSEFPSQPHRGLILYHFLCIFLDIPCLILMLLFAMPGCYRIPSVWQEFKGRKVTLGRFGPEFHCFVLTNVLEFFVDIPFILMGLVVTLSCWRTRVLWATLLDEEHFKPWQGCSVSSNRVWIRRFAAWTHLFNLLFDIVAIPLLLVVYIFRYAPASKRLSLTTKNFSVFAEQRCRRLLSNISQDIGGAEDRHALIAAQCPNTNRDHETHCVIISEFIAVVLDMLTSPFFLVAFFAPWRHALFWRAFRDPKKCLSDCDRRLLCLHQACMVILDIPIFCMFIVVMLSLWRAFPLMHQVKAFAKSLKSKQKQIVTASSNISNEGIDKQCDDRMGQKQDPNSTLLLDSQKVPIEETPDPIANATCCGLVPLRAWEKIFGFSAKLHLLVVSNFFMVILDLPLIIMNYILLLTWRHGPVRELLTREFVGFHDYNLGMEGRNLALCFHFLLLILDLPVLVVFLALMPTWRNCRVIRLLRDLDLAPPPADTSAPVLVHSDLDEAKAAGERAIGVSPPSKENSAALPDVITTKTKLHHDCVAVPVDPSVQASLAAPATGPKRVSVPIGRHHELILRQFLYWIIDVPFVAAFAILWRIPLCWRVLYFPRHPIAEAGGCDWPHADWKHFLRREQERDWMIRTLLLRQLYLGVLDLFVFVAMIILVLFPWRRKAAWQAYKMRLWTISGDPFDQSPNDVERRASVLERTASMKLLDAKMNSKQATFEDPDSWRCDDPLYPRWDEHNGVKNDGYWMLEVEGSQVCV